MINCAISTGSAFFSRKTRVVETVSIDRIKRRHDFHDVVDVHLRVGDDERVAVLVGRERRRARHQRAEVLRRLRRVDVPQRDDLHHHVGRQRNLLGVVAGVNRNVLFLGLVLRGHDQVPALDAGAVAILVQRDIEQLHRLLLRNRLGAPHVHRAAHRSFEHDDKSGGVAHVIQHRLERRAAKIEPQSRPRTRRRPASDSGAAASVAGDGGACWARPLAASAASPSHSVEISRLVFIVSIVSVFAPSVV